MISQEVTICVIWSWSKSQLHSFDLFVQPCCGSHFEHWCNWTIYTICTDPSASIQSQAEMDVISHRENLRIQSLWSYLMTVLSPIPQIISNQIQIWDGYCRGKPLPRSAQYLRSKTWSEQSMDDQGMSFWPISFVARSCRVVLVGPAAWRHNGSWAPLLHSPPKLS